MNEILDTRTRAIMAQSSKLAEMVLELVGSETITRISNGILAEPTGNTIVPLLNSELLVALSEIDNYGLALELDTSYVTNRIYSYYRNSSIAKLYSEPLTEMETIMN